MRLKVVHTYPVAFVPYRCTNSRSEKFRCETEVDIREVDVACLKTVARIGQPGARSRFEPAADGSLRDLVAFEGRFWLDHGSAADIQDAFEAGAVANGFLDGVDDLSAGWTGNGGAYSPAVLKFTNEMTVRRSNSGEMRKWNDDKGARIAAKIRERACDAFVAGGRFYVRESEPVIAVRNGERARIEPIKDPGERWGRYYGSERLEGYSRADRHWRLDRLQEAFSSFRNTGEAPHSQDPIVEIVDASHLRQDDDGNALFLELSSAAWELRDGQTGLKRREAEAMYDLRDAFEACWRTTGPSLVGAARAVAALDVPGATPHALAAAEYARHGLDRWGSHPADGREWVAAGLSLTATRQPKDIIVSEILSRERLAIHGRAAGIDWESLEGDAMSGTIRLFAARRVGYSAAGSVLAGIDRDNHLVVWAFRGSGQDNDLRAALDAHLSANGVPSPIPPSPAAGVSP